MSLVKCLRESHGAGDIVVHASNKRNFILVSRLANSLHESFGVYAIAPPNHSSHHSHLDSLIQEQADELAHLTPAQNSFSLIGDCLAGHMTLKLAEYLTSADLSPRRVMLLDTTPTKGYFESTAFGVLKLPGDVEEFGYLGAALLDLDASLRRQDLSRSDWAKELFATVYRYRSDIADALTRIAALDCEDGKELAVLYLNWAKLISITLVTPGICYPGPVTLLASVEAAMLPLLDRWKSGLPNMTLRETATPHSDIIFTPVIREILDCSLLYNRPLSCLPIDFEDQLYWIQH